MQKLLLSRLQPQGKTSIILSKRVVIRTGDESDDWYGGLFICIPMPLKWTKQTLQCATRNSHVIYGQSWPWPAWKDDSGI